MVIRLLLIAVAAAVMMTAPVIAADPQPTVGYVDVQSVFDKYNKTVSSRTELEAMGRQMDEQLQMLNTYRLITEEERQELLELTAKPNPTDKDKERIKAIQDQEKALDAELKNLETKNPPTEEESARLKDLQDRQAKTQESLNSLGMQFQNKFNEKQKALTEEIRNDILAAVDVIAKQKGLSVVVDKVAVLSGGVDITEPVLESLNKKK